MTEVRPPEAEVIVVMVPCSCWKVLRVMAMYLKQSCWLPEKGLLDSSKLKAFRDKGMACQMLFKGLDALPLTLSLFHSK
jgi:hypothetical protein